MKYPLRTDYETVVKYPDRFIYDGILQQGKPVKQKQNQNFLLSHNGGKAVVYEIQTNPKKYALKCWIEDLGDLKIRYKAIDAYLKTVQLPYFVDFAYQEQGILVNGQRFPIIRMEWVDGISFKDFISNNINNPTSIRNFAEKFLEILFEELKKNLLRIVKLILKDIYRTTKDKRVLIIQSLLEAGEFIVQTVVNYRECKSLVGAIQKILKLINKKLPGTGINKALLAFADALPGFSPERAAINAIESMQGYGLRTGPTPDGQPNKMTFYQIATQKGLSVEDAKNGVVDIGISVITGLPIGKSR